MTGLQLSFFLVLLPTLAFLAILRGAISSLERKIDRLSAKIDLVLKASNIETEPTANLSDRVRKAMSAGRKIEAIKLLREETGLTLREAKDAVDKIMG